MVRWSGSILYVVGIQVASPSLYGDAVLVVWSGLDLYPPESWWSESGLDLYSPKSSLVWSWI